MQTSNADLFYKHFKSLDDPRASTHNKRHELKDILLLTILAIICGAESWVEIELFGRAKER